MLATYESLSFKETEGNSSQAGRDLKKVIENDLSKAIRRMVCWIWRLAPPLIKCYGTPRLKGKGLESQGLRDHTLPEKVGSPGKGLSMGFTPHLGEKTSSNES